MHDLKVNRREEELCGPDEKTQPDYAVRLYENHYFQVL